jgi:hypothetical protein
LQIANFIEVHLAAVDRAVPLAATKNRRITVPTWLGWIPKFRQPSGEHRVTEHDISSSRPLHPVWRKTRQPHASFWPAAQSER